MSGSSPGDVAAGPRHHEATKFPNDEDGARGSPRGTASNEISRLPSADRDHCIETGRQPAPMTRLVPVAELVAWRLALDLLEAQGTPGVVTADVSAALRRRGWWVA